MSVISSRVSSVSSILKSPGIRSQLVKQSNRVYFKFPKNIKDILFNFEVHNGIKDYEDLLCILRESNVKDNDLVDFLCEMRQCTSLLGPVHKSFIDVLLEINWLDRSPEVISTYKIFLEDLISAQVHHGKCIIDRLVEQFKPAKGDDTEWEAGGCKTKDMERLNHIHDVLCKILNIVPMSSKLLLHSVRSRFPYIIHGTRAHEVYVHALLQLLDYAPQLRSDILSLIINRLMILDVNIPRLEANTSEDVPMECNDSDPILDNDTDINEKNKENITQLHPIAHTLDVCMQQVFDFIYNTCYVKGKLDKKSLKSLYFELLKIFETIILPTHASQYVQYIMFYICSFKVIVINAFLGWLWEKTTDPNVPSILRATAVSYSAGLLSTASFVPLRVVKATQLDMANWIHNYIDMHENSDTISNDPRDHPVFYPVCEALFSIIINRHKDFIDIKNIRCLHQLNLAKIVTCKLNPLKSCRSDIVHNFAEISQMYQLAYCYTIIELNERNRLPIIQDTNTTDLILDSFSPFTTYNLNYSGERLISLFYDCSKNNVSKPISKPESDPDQSDTEDFFQ